MTHLPFRIRTLAAAAALSLLAAACGDDDVVEGDEPATASVEITFAGTGAGSQTLVWNTNTQAVTPSTLNIPAGQSRTVTAVFKRADGSADPVITESGFRLDFNVTGTGITVTKTSNLTATITRAASGSGSFTVDLEHLGEGHTEYGPSNAITITP